MAKPVKSFNILHPKKEFPDGQRSDDKQIGLLTFNKRLGELNIGNNEGNILKKLGMLDGVDAVSQAGTYTVQIMLAATFDFDEVWNEIKEIADVATAGILIAGNFKK